MTAATLTLADFLLARIAEDEAVAGHRDLVTFGAEQRAIVGAPNDPFDPARVLAECAAKRAIVNSRATFESVAAKTTDLGPKMTSAGAVAGLDVAIRYLASAYADHPDYRSEWAL